MNRKAFFSCNRFCWSCIARSHIQQQNCNRSLSTAVSKCDCTNNRQTLVLGIFLCLGLSVITRLNSPLDNILGLDQMFTSMYCYVWLPSYQLALTHLSFTAQVTEIMQASYSCPTHQEPGCTRLGLSVCMTLLSFYGSYTPNAWQKTDSSGLSSPRNHRVVMLTLDLRKVTVGWYPLDSRVQTVPPVNLCGT